MAKEYWDLCNADLFAYPCEDGLRVVDCEDDFIAMLPKEWTKKQAIAWAQGYTFNRQQAYTAGHAQGEYQARRKMQEALGIADELVALRNDIRTLALVLYHHDGVCKEDVAELAGRYDG